MINFAKGAAITSDDDSDTTPGNLPPRPPITRTNLILICVFVPVGVILIIGLVFLCVRIQRQRNKFKDAIKKDKKGKVILDVKQLDMSGISALTTMKTEAATTAVETGEVDEANEEEEKPKIKKIAKKGKKAIAKPKKKGAKGKKEMIDRSDCRFQFFL